MTQQLSGYVNVHVKNRANWQHVFRTRHKAEKTQMPHGARELLAGSVIMHSAVDKK